jgi:alpha-galactosidase
MNQVKFAIIGAGSVSFSPATVADILLSPLFATVEDLSIHLMDIAPEALELSRGYAVAAAAKIGRKATISATTDLRAAVAGANFVITAIELERYTYWSMDFHIPRRYGFRQVYGENGGPGGMFHFLRNVGPMLDIAHAMEELCPDAWLLNYTNPEAKLVEAIAKLTRIKVVGLCHGEQMGLDQLSRFLDIPKADIEGKVAGLNHFGWFTSVRRRSTGEDLYPMLRERERKAELLSDWDELGLSRIMFRTYGLWPYPGTNHIGEYIAWSDAFLASALVQYYHDPVVETPWRSSRTPELIYSFASNPTARPLYGEAPSAGDPGFTARFEVGDELRVSNEYGIRIAEAIFFDQPTWIGAVNVRNENYIPGILAGMAVEIPARFDGQGVHPETSLALPTAVAAMVNVQGAIHELLIQAFVEQSRPKLLQAILLDPTISNYANAVALIDEMFRLQADILPPLVW